MTIRIVFAGTPAFALPTLQMLLEQPDCEVVGIATQPDRRSGRGMRLTPSPVRSVAIDAGIDHITPVSLRNHPQAQNWLETKHPDLLVVVAFGMLLPDSWLDIPRIAPVNLHASLLPRWRGAAPIERALLAGDTTTGVCLMRMESGLDCGPIYARRSIEINGLSGGDLWQRLSQLSADLLQETLGPLVSGQLRAEPQMEDGVTYAKKIEAKDRELNWQQTADGIDRVVRCFAPRPGARCKVASGPLKGKWLKVLRGRPDRVEHPPATGACTLMNGAIIVGCGGNTAYRIEQLQIEGKPMAEAEPFWRGLRGQELLLC